MKFLYAPWRIAYLIGRKKTQMCPFCQQHTTKNDAEHLILQRGKHCYVMMNLYPYNTAHTMVLPYRHVADLSQLAEEERNELFSLATSAIEKIKFCYNPDGFNLGLNLGKSAGAGMPDHLHLHILPRWDGDTNFLPLLTDTKQISYDILSVYERLKEVF